MIRNAAIAETAVQATPLPLSHRVVVDENHIGSINFMIARAGVARQMEWQAVDVL